MKTNDWDINPQHYLTDTEGNFVLKKDGTPKKKPGRQQNKSLKTKQREQGIEDIQIESSAKEVEEINTKTKELKDAIIDGINCFNGK